MGLENYSSVFLKYYGTSEVLVSVKFYVSNSVVSSLHGKVLKAQVFGPQNALFGINDFIEHPTFSRGEDWIMCCEISFDLKTIAIPRTVQAVTKKEANSEENVLERDFQDDLAKLFEDGILSDVIITIGQEKKPLHKAILASRSQVFRAMFEHDMIEKKQNVVNIVDIKKEVAMELFRYMYTGRVNDIEKLSVDELLIAAEKYAITELKVMCQKTLSDNLNFDNALQYLTLASVHNSTDLKKKATDFIVKYLNKFVDKPEFKRLDQSIMCKLLSAVAKKNTY